MSETRCDDEGLIRLEVGEVFRQLNKYLSVVCFERVMEMPGGVMLITIRKIFQTRFDWRATPQWHCFMAIYIYTRHWPLRREKNKKIKKHPAEDRGLGSQKRQEISTLLHIGLSLPPSHNFSYSSSGTSQTERKK